VGERVLGQVVVVVRERRQILDLTLVPILLGSDQAQVAVPEVVGRSIGLRLFLSPVFCAWIGIPKHRSPCYNLQFFP